MKLELFIFGITGFLIYNMYYDGYYSKLILSYKKYYSMALIGFLAICFYIMIKRNPLQTKNMLLYTNNMIKYMPIDKSSMDMITPIFDLSTKSSSFFHQGHNPSLIQQQHHNLMMSSSGVKPVKRSVSETKKKYVASMQDWKCGQCNQKLSYTFEIDHKIRLENGGGNDVTNLVALCRECHGQKTAMENM
jgi:hypothetical protein